MFVTMTIGSPRRDKEENSCDYCKEQDKRDVKGFIGHRAGFIELLELRSLVIAHSS